MIEEFKKYPGETIVLGCLAGIAEQRLKKSFKGKSFAVSSGNLIKLKDLAEVFEKLASCKLKIKWGQRPYREREVMTPWSDGIKIPGWSPKVSIEEGIAKLLRYRKIEI